LSKVVCASRVIRTAGLDAIISSTVGLAMHMLISEIVRGFKLVFDRSDLSPSSTLFLSRARWRIWWQEWRRYLRFDILGPDYCFGSLSLGIDIPAWTDFTSLSNGSSSSLGCAMHCLLLYKRWAIDLFVPSTSRLKTTTSPTKNKLYTMTTSLAPTTTSVLNQVTRIL